MSSAFAALDCRIFHFHVVGLDHELSKLAPVHANFFAQEKKIKKRKRKRKCFEQQHGQNVVWIPVCDCVDNGDSDSGR